MGLDNNCTGEYSLSNATYSEQFSNECEGEEHIDNTSSVLLNIVRGERDDVGIIMTNVSNMECMQDCQAKCQRINEVSSLDRQGFRWTEIYFGHFVQAAPILFGHLEIFKDIFSTLTFTTIKGNCHLPFSN